MVLLFLKSGSSSFLINLACLNWFTVNSTASHSVDSSTNKISAVNIFTGVPIVYIAPISNYCLLYHNQKSQNNVDSQLYDQLRQTTIWFYRIFLFVCWKVWLTGSWKIEQRTRLNTWRQYFRFMHTAPPPFPKLTDHTISLCLEQTTRKVMLCHA